MGAPAHNVILSGSVTKREAIGSGAITPGHLLQLNSTAGQVKVHATSGGDAAPIFARENESIGGKISTAYSSADTVHYFIAHPGAVVYALVAAGASAITVGDPLESAGDGTLKKHTAKAWDVGVTTSINETQYSAPIVARALESKDNSGGSAAVRIRAMII